ncbi:MAG: Ribonuclease P protein component [Microgenomates group bacterium Gr01-1014_93]|nr:MAG: Ribonuclease P protein component [Microgenomates group bacterium Gr01-1014_93]
MLSKDKRLNLKTDFKWAVSGTRLETKYITLFLKEGQTNSPRIGIASSSKVFKKAVERNRARRLTSRAFEDIYTKLPGSINIVALPKTGILSVKSEEVIKDLNEKIGYLFT